MKTSTVEYHIATYSGTVEFTHEEDLDQELIIAKAKQILRRQAGSFPLGYQSWKVIS